MLLESLHISIHTVIKSFIKTCILSSASFVISGTLPVMTMGQYPRVCKKRLISFTCTMQHKFDVETCQAHYRPLGGQYKVTATHLSTDCGRLTDDIMLFMVDLTRNS